MVPIRLNTLVSGISLYGIWQGVYYLYYWQGFFGQKFFFLYVLGIECWTSVKTTHLVQSTFTCNLTYCMNWSFSCVLKLCCLCDFITEAAEKVTATGEVSTASEPVVPEKFELLHDVAMLHVVAMESRQTRATLISDIGPHRRALCAYKDLQIRRKLCGLDSVSREYIFIHLWHINNSYSIMYILSIYFT